MRGKPFFRREDANSRAHSRWAGKLSAAALTVAAATCVTVPLVGFGAATPATAEPQPERVLVAVYTPTPSGTVTDAVESPPPTPSPGKVPTGVLPDLPPPPPPVEVPAAVLQPETGGTGPEGAVLPYVPVKVDSSGCPVEAPAGTMRSGSDSIGVNELCRKSVKQARSKAAAQAIMYAFSRLGTPYSQPGRTSVGYYDCSSLVGRSYLEGAGVTTFFGNYPYTGSYADEPSWQGVLTKVTDHRPGDIRIMWRPGTTMAGSAGNNGHAQMYLADGYVIQSGGGGGGDSRVNVSDDSTWGWSYQNFAYTGR